VLRGYVRNEGCAAGALEIRVRGNQILESRRMREVALRGSEVEDVREIRAGRGSKHWKAGEWMVDVKMEG